jgi:hypothetical protein
MVRGSASVAEILDLVDRYIDLFEQGPTVEAILAIAGPGERFDFSGGRQIEHTTDDATVSIGINRDPEFGIWKVSISDMRIPPSLDGIVERYGPGDRGPYSSPGSYPYKWFGLRTTGQDRPVSLTVSMYRDAVSKIMVDR